jgi:hypothetical protein
MSASAAMKVEDAPGLVPFSKMLEAQKEAALAELTEQLGRAGGAPGLVARLSGLLRLAPNGTFHLQLEIPRLTHLPTSKWLGTTDHERWVLEIICRPLPAGASTVGLLWTATTSTTLPIAKAVALVADPATSPIAELDRRRAEVESGAAMRRYLAATEDEEKRDQASQALTQKNAVRIRRWQELPKLLQDICAAAGTTGDEKLIAFARRMVELAPGSSDSTLPPDWLWPLSG